MKQIRKIISLLLSSIMILTSIPMTAYAKTSTAANKKEANIILFAYFNNDTQESADEYYSANTQKLIGIFDGDYGRSFKNYINTISYGKLEIENIIPQYDGTTIKAAKLNLSLEQAAADDCDSQIIESLVNSMPSIADKTVDYDGDGIADNIMIVLKTEDTYSDVESGATLVAHRGQYVGGAKINGKGLYNYNIYGTDRVLFEESGLVGHEFLHTLGYPDLYRNSGSDNPVYIWSIMGGVTKCPQYPLAYERMYFSDWIDIDEVSQSTSLTLDTQSNANGNQAFILKSPLNDHEVFVVEYRVKPVRDYIEKDSLDYYIGGTGVIVYRIDTTVEGLSNIKGGTGIYVFRPQDGQPGYSSYEKTSVNNAYLPYSGTDGSRNSIGSSDMSMHLADGALTFSDGSNSGIEISNVSLSADGSQATCDITIPQKDDYDLWENLNYVNSNSDDTRAVTIANVNDDLYSVSFDDGKIISRKNSNGQWSDFAPSITDSYVQALNLERLGDNLYMAYYDMDSSYTEAIKLYRYNITSGGSWTLVKRITNASAGVDLGVVDNELYMTYLTYNAVNGWETDINLVQLNGNELNNLGVCDSAMVGQPKIANYNNELYIAYRNAMGNTINVKKYNGGGFDTVSDGTLKASYYDIKSDGDKLYIALGGGALKMASYDGATWQTGTASDIQCGEPGLAVIDGNLFVLASPQTETGNLKMYHYENDEYIQEGESIDASSSDITIRTIDKNIYLSYILFANSKIVIKSKLAKQITPPKEADKTALEAAIARANVHLTGDYSDDTINALSDIVATCTPLLTDNVATQKQIDTATRNILEAIYSLKAILHLDISTKDGTYTANINEEISSNTQYDLVSGTKITLNATANDDFVFVGWFDTISKRIMSTSNQYIFAISTNTSLKALFVKNQSATLTFANSSGFVKSMITKTTAQWSAFNSIDNILPQVPYKYGYANGAWVYNDEQVLTKLKAGENVTITPEYTVVDDTLPTPPEATNVPVLELYFKLDDDKNVGSFVMAAGFPENCRVESVGVAFYYKDAATFNPVTDKFELLLNNQMTASRFNTDELQNIYIVNVKNFSNKYNRSARGYVTYYDENNILQTVYSNQINIVNRQEA